MTTQHFVLFYFIIFKLALLFTVYAFEQKSVIETGFVRDTERKGKDNYALTNQGELVARFTRPFRFAALNQSTAVSLVHVMTLPPQIRCSNTTSW